MDNSAYKKLLRELQQGLIKIPTGDWTPSSKWDRSGLVLEVAARIKPRPVLEQLELF